MLDDQLFRRSIILTTHAMEEAEALSSRMCIMVGGRIRALGTVQVTHTNTAASSNTMSPQPVCSLSCTAAIHSSF